MAEARAREHVRLRKADKVERTGENVHAADDRGVNPAAPETDDGFVEGDQRRRTGRVDGEARPVKVENIRNTIGNNGEGIARHHIGVASRGIVDPQIAVIERRGADENTRFASRYGGWFDSGVFKRLPCELEQQPLLRIDLLRFARRKTEGRGIESPNIVERAGGPSIAPATLPSARVRQSLLRPAIIGDARNRASSRC